MHKAKIKHMLAVLALTGIVALTGCGNSDEQATSQATSQMTTEASSVKATEKATQKATQQSTEKATAASTQATQAQVAVGSTIKMGKFDGKELEWLVIAKENGKALVIASSPVASRDFNATQVNVAWETSTLRSWLNNDFYNAAFTDAEKNRILTTTVVAEVNPNYPAANPGNNTNDKVYLLSMSEAGKYFADNNARKCVYKSEDSYWWLRSVGDNGTGAAYVNQSGAICDRLSNCNYYTKGGTYHDHYGGVRPIMWISN